MKPLLIIAVALLITALSATVRTGSIEGTVVERSTRQPLSSVAVSVLGANMGTYTDARGRFLIKDIPPGTYRVEASMIGYKTLVKTDVVVSINRVATLNFRLNQQAIELGGVVVKPDYFQKDADKPVSTKTLTSEEILSQAGSRGDVFKVVQAMPGVGGTRSTSSNLVVRGGSPDENLTLLDNMEIYNPLHFSRPGASRGGAISIINPNLLEGVEFMTGGFPVEYGDKMSSVFEMKVKDGNRTRYNTDVNLSLTGGGLMLDGPLPGDGNLVFAGRYGNYTWLTSLMGFKMPMQYGDAVGKASYNLGAYHKLSILGFYYRDYLKLEGGTTAWGRADYGYRQTDDYGTALGLNWRYLFREKGYVLTTAGFTSSGWNSGMGTEENPDLMGGDIVEDEVFARSQVVYIVSDALQVKGGLILKGIDSYRYTWMPEDSNRAGEVIPADTVNYDPGLTFKGGGYVQFTVRPFSGLSLTPGLRYDYYAITAEHKLSPRLAGSYSITEGTSLNAAWGYYYQTPEPYEIAQDTSNLDLKSSLAIHYIAGIEQLIGKDIKASVEVYYKDYSDLIVEGETMGVLSNQGLGDAYGVELYLQKKMTKNLVGSAAYTWSVARRQDADTADWYYSDFDQTHDFTLLGSYKLADKWQFSARFELGTGNPYTPVAGSELRDGNWYLVEGEHNSERYPLSHKLDIRIDRNFHFKQFTISAYLDVWNVYNNSNVAAYRYNVDDEGNITTEEIYDLGITPDVGISVQF